MASSAAAIAIGAPFSAGCRKSSTLLSSGASFVIWSIKPQSSACWHETRRPNRIISFALEDPMSLGSRWVPPAPGMIPSWHSG